MIAEVGNVPTGATPFVMLGFAPGNIGLGVIGAPGCA
jgi:hypothetical protein